MTIPWPTTKAEADRAAGRIAAHFLREYAENGLLADHNTCPHCNEDGTCASLELAGASLRELAAKLERDVRTVGGAGRGGAEGSITTHAISSGGVGGNESGR